jgi:hypothetical protein
MRVVEPVEEHFSEGEPDLEPPEELALAELDEDAVLEEELDNEDVLEQDVDDELLTATLEDLAHKADDDQAEDSEADEASWDLEVDELEDLEESLDHLLEERLANEGRPVLEPRPGAPAVARCGKGEFVCRRCFLVRSRSQLADPVALVCADCS